MGQRKNDWKCDICIGANSYSINQPAVTELLKKMHDDFSSQISIVNENVNSVKSQLDSVQETVKTLQNLGSSLSVKMKKERSNKKINSGE